MTAAGRTDDLRSEALAAARGLRDGEQALAGALRALREDSERTAEAYRAVVASLATALAARDGYTGAHSDIVHDLAVAVAGRLGIEGRPLAEIEAVALLHDIGKIGIPDHVLHKRGPLDEPEWELMRQHPVIGERILRPLPGLADVATAVRHEHERWDGTGYPDGLRGAEIPLASRVVLACDSFNALVSDRPYRAGLGVAAACEELRRNAGSQFDPAVVEALLASIDAQGAVVRVAAAPRPPALAAEASELDAQRLEREVHALITVVSAAASVESLESLADVAADQVCAAIGATSVAISRWDAESKVLRVLVNAGELAPGEERRPADETYPLAGDAALGALALQGSAYATSLDDDDGLDAEKDLLRSIGRHACAAVPIMLGGEAWGELWASRVAGLPVFGDRDLQFMHAVAGQIAAAVGRTELFARMADLAFRDPLTGVGNRRALDERLEVDLRDHPRLDVPYALLLCDADNLKELNDAAGHEAGDRALRAVAAALAAHAPIEGAPVFRIGGDEFAVLLPDVDAESAVAYGEHVIAFLAVSAEAALTASCGVAMLDQAMTRPADLLRAADTAQYAAKRGGRGRVCLADAQPSIDWRRPPDPAETERRRPARQTEADVPTLLAAAIAALDGPLLRAGVAQRVEDVAARLAAAVDAARAAVSHTPPRGATIDVQYMVDARRGRAWRPELGASAETWPLDDYPTTAAILDGGSFVLAVDDADADPAEVAVLREFGNATLLAAAARGGDGAWLIELYGDARTLPFHGIEHAARLLLVEAVRASRSARAPTRRVA